MSDPQTAISDLIDSFGYTEERIAHEVRELNAKLTTSQSSVHRIKTSKQRARWDEGQAILLLRARVAAEAEAAAEKQRAAGGGAASPRHSAAERV